MMKTLSPNFQDSNLLKSTLKASSTKAKVHPKIPPIAEQFQHLSNLHIGTPKLNTLESERDQQLSVTSKTNRKTLFSNRKHVKIPNAIQESPLEFRFREKKDNKSLTAKNTINGQVPNILKSNKSQSTTISPRRETEDEPKATPETENYRNLLGKDSAAQGTEELLQLLSKKDAEINELKQSISQIKDRVKDLKLIKKKFGVLDLKAKLKKQEEVVDLSSNRLSPHNYGKTLTDAYSLDTDEIVYEDRRLINRAYHTSVRCNSETRIPSFANLHYLNDVSLERKLSNGTTLLNLSPQSYAHIKTNSRGSPSELMRQLSMRLQQADSSIINKSRMQTLKSIYMSLGQDSRKSTKKLRLKRRPNKSLNKVVLGKSPDFMKEAKVEREKAAKGMYIEGKARRLLKGKTDKIVNISVESPTWDTSKKEKSSILKQDLAGLVDRFKRVLESYSEQRKELQINTLRLLEKMAELPTRENVNKKQA